jgi:hypothetical protein
VSVGDLDQRFARPLVASSSIALRTQAMVGSAAWALSAACCPLRKELPNSGDPGGVSPSLADQAELPDFTASLVGSSTSGDLFICAKDLVVEANPTGASLQPAFPR